MIFFAVSKRIRALKPKAFAWKGTPHQMGATREMEELEKKKWHTKLTP